MRKISEREYKYQSVIKEIVKRYIMRKQQRDLNAGVTEDDLNEIKQDISSLRFELLEIFKNNQFKVDTLKQNPSKQFNNKFKNFKNIFFLIKVKRKRGKLNLEKAMAQTKFDENNLNLFDSFKLKTKLNQSLDTDSNFKNSKRSNCSNNMENNREVNLKEIRETKGKVNQQSTPTMYRIAMRLKRLTDLKIKKTNSESIFEPDQSDLKKEKILTKQKSSIEISDENFNFKLGDCNKILIQ